MTIFINNLRISASAAADEDARLLQEVVQTLKVDAAAVAAIEIKRRSLDARQKRRIVYEYQLAVKLHEDLEQTLPPSEHYQLGADETGADPLEGVVTWQGHHRPVVVGSGPCGIFAALILAEAGARPIIIERGEAVDERIKTVTKLRTQGEFQSESNYCFGEGGAGTFSDGKLTCSRRHPFVSYLFKKWVEFGAPKQILYDALPHIGSDNLVTVARNMRATITGMGGTFLFNRTLETIEQNTGRSHYSLSLSDGSTLDTEHVILAIGHAARDTFRMLHRLGLRLKPKAFAIGSRIEHPQSFIDEIQYGKNQHLPAASYKLTARAGDRGVWSFCMCPGGILLPTNSQPEHLSVNGMSFYSRSSGFANSALVVNVRQEDFYKGSPLDGIEFQELLEQKAFRYGGGGYNMPAQRLNDFLKGRVGKGEIQSSYLPGLRHARIDQLLPRFVAESLQEAVIQFNRKMPGFISDQALLVGTETKTSSPVTICREDDTFHAVGYPGIYPAGEGAGYAGGIVSAALDGVHTALSILKAHASS
jgi:uncharacterized FAD-dependent dehydrogenase